MIRSTVLIALALIVLLNFIFPNYAQSIPSYTYTIQADLPAQPAEWAEGSFNVAALSSDDSIVSITLDFPFQFFGANRTSVSVSSNGNLQFSTSSTAYSTPTLPTSTTSYLPIAAFFFSDLNPGTDDSGPVLYRTEGVAPSRSLVIRFANVTVLGSTGDFVYVEVRLNENHSMTWGYYYIPLNTRAVTVGVQNDQLINSNYDYTAVWNSSPMNQTMLDLLVGKNIYWSIPPPAVPITFRSNTSGEYSVTHTAGATLLDIGTATWNVVQTSDDDIDALVIGFPFYFYGVQYENISMSSNGYMQLGTATLTSTSGQAVPAGNSARVPLIAAFWADLYPGTSNTLQYATFGDMGSRQFVARWWNITYYGDRTKFLQFDVILHETTNVVEVRYYYLTPYSVNLLIAIQNQTSSTSSNPGYAYLNNAARIDSNGLINILNGSTLSYTPGGVVPLPSSTGSSGSEPSSTASAAESSVPIVPSESSSASTPMESSSASMMVPSSSSGEAVPSQSSSAMTPPIESSSSTPMIPVQSSSAETPMMSSSAIMASSTETPVMSSSASAALSSSAIVIPTGCNFNQNTPLGTIINELKINRGIEGLGPSFGPQFMDALSSFFRSARPNALLPSLGCGGIIGFNNRVGNIVPENENESVVRVLVIPNTDTSNPNATVISPEEASTTFSDPGLSTSLQAAGLPIVTQSQITAKRCPDGRDIALDDSCDGGDDDDSGLTDGEKAGIIVGSVVGGLLLIGLCICLLVSMRRRKSYSSSNTYHTQKTAARGRGVEMGEYDRTEVV